MDEAAPDLSIILVSWNTRELTRSCIESIHKNAGGVSCEIVAVDNASRDGTADMIEREFREVALIRNDENAGFAKANNQAIGRCRGRHILLLNTDTLVREGAIEKMVRFLDSHPEAGICGARLVDGAGAPSRAYGAFPTLWRLFAQQLPFWGRLPESLRPVSGKVEGGGEPFEVEWVSGAALAIRSEAAASIGPLDENVFMYSEDSDWCYRAGKAGWKAYIAPGAEITHLCGKSTEGVSAWARVQLSWSGYYFCRKHYGRLWTLAAKAIVLGSMALWLAVLGLANIVAKDCRSA